MKKKIQKYLSGEREGFSLIELIIVIAIMAILIGVVALVVLPYMSSSRVSKDHDTLKQVATAFKSAVAVKQSQANIAGKTFDQLDTDLKAQINKLLDGDVATAKSGLSSDNAKGKDFYFTYDSTGCYVSIGSAAGDDDGEGEKFTTKAGSAS